MPSWIGWHPTSSYTGFFCQPTLSYLILPQLTTSPSYVVFYCQPTRDSTPSCLSLPHLTTAYPVVPSYPSLHCILLPAYLTSNPVHTAGSCRFRQVHAGSCRLKTNPENLVQKITSLPTTTYPKWHWYSLNIC